MSEDERQEMLGTVAEAHAGLREVAFKLRRQLTRKAPALKAAVKAEQEIYRLRRELQQFVVTDPDPAQGREPLGEIRRGGKVRRYRAPAAGRGSRRRALKRILRTVPEARISR